MNYINIKCPKCGNMTGVQYTSDYYTPWFTYACSRCGCDHDGDGVETDWAAYNVAYEAAYDADAAYREQEFI